MNRIEKIGAVRRLLAAGQPTIGSWIQIPDGSVAEIMGRAGYDWVAVDLEHGAIARHQLPELFRALELGGTLPLARLASGSVQDCKAALDSGAGGVIVPMVDSAEFLTEVRAASRWPPAGTRGVGFSRANLFGKYFGEYAEEAQAPLLVAMIEHVAAVDRLDSILQVAGLDAVMIGPYDLSASLGASGQFDGPLYESTLERIRASCGRHRIPCGVHVVMSDPAALAQRIGEGYRFIAYGIDAVFLTTAAERPSGP